ncbi:MAG: DUF2637 domain-containing protein [Dehalococcoidia bacterium]
MTATPRPPWIVWLGLAVVLVAAAVLSFDALRALAVAVGISPALAWLLPIAVDAGAAVSCAVWLGRRATADAARFAGRMTWSLLAVTVLGNAIQLGIHADGASPWRVALAVAVGAIPPAVVGSTVHLVVLLVRGGIRADEDEAPVVLLEDEVAPLGLDWAQPPTPAATVAATAAPDPVPEAAPAATTGETEDERRKREQRDRAKRARLHRNGDHSTCNPQRCSDARRLQAVS